MFVLWIAENENRILLVFWEKLCGQLIGNPHPKQQSNLAFGCKSISEQCSLRLWLRLIIK